MSEATDYNSTALQNIKDLLVLMKITGALEEDPTIRQRASTFISEKILSKDLPSKKLNTTIPNFYRIAGEDIHRVFNFPHVKEEFDQDFADFFINNYYKLITTEKRISGFIQRIYDSFDKIKETCTSNKGDQRQLKVTVEKCLNFFSADKFKNVKKGEEKLAGLVGLWFDNEGAWEKAKRG